jgi:hypothetical protein
VQKSCQFLGRVLKGQDTFLQFTEKLKKSPQKISQALVFQRFEAFSVFFSVAFQWLFSGEKSLIFNALQTSRKRLSHNAFKHAKRCGRVGQG